MNPDEVVAIGAALQAGIFSGEVRDILLLDVSPLSLGVETLGGLMDTIIPRNTSIPTRKSQVYSTAEDGQSNVEIQVLQGEREMASDNKSLGTFRLDGIPPAPRGVPQIEVTFDIDANGILSVTAKDKGSGKEQSISITGASTLSDNEVEKMVKDAEANASADKEKRERIDLKNRAETLVYQAEKQLGELGDKVGAEDKSKVEASCAKLKEAIEKEDFDAIRLGLQALPDLLHSVISNGDGQSSQNQRSSNSNDNVSQLTQRSALKLESANLLKYILENLNKERNDLISAAGYLDSSRNLLINEFYDELLKNSLGFPEEQNDEWDSTVEFLYERGDVWSPIIENGLITGRYGLRISAIARQYDWSTTSWESIDEQEREDHLDSPYEVQSWTQKGVVSYNNYSLERACAGFQGDFTHIFRPSFDHLDITEDHGQTLDEFLECCELHPKFYIELATRFSWCTDEMLRR